MVKDYAQKTGPLVSVLIPTYNRRQYLPVALFSVVHQDYSNIEIFVVRDGGQDVSDIVKSFDDKRIVFINRKENCGIAYSLNQALSRANGKYICYLGDDDLYYRHHVRTLVDVLESGTDCEVAYSDLYRTYCRIRPDGERQVLSKVVDISRDFDRFVMLYFNHTLHVSLMHRRDLLEKTGLYNENLNVLIDWDLTRRLVFFTDFEGVHEITGEFYNPVGEFDRVSVRRRKDKKEYLRNVMTIRTTRPPKPWSKIKDVSIIFAAEKLDEQAGKTLSSIWEYTFYPYQVYFPVGPADLNRFDSEMPNVITIPVDSESTGMERIETALTKCEGDYVAIVPGGYSIKEFWLEDSLYALINSGAEHECFELEGSTDRLWAVLVKKDDLKYARKHFRELSVRESLKAAGVRIRRLTPEEIPFQFDQLLLEARLAERDEHWAQAGEIFEYIAENYRNEFWMQAFAANALFRAGRLNKAAELSGQLNQQRPTVDTLLLEAKLKRKENDLKSAIGLLERAKQILGFEFGTVCSNEEMSKGKDFYGHNARQYG